MPLLNSLTSAEDAERLAFGLVSNAAVIGRGLQTRAARVEIQTFTITGWDATDAFSIINPVTLEETIPFVHTTNGAATDVQAAMRTLTGDAALTCTGTVNVGPFVCTWVNQTTRQLLYTVGRGTAGAAGTMAVTQQGGVG
jgi:hypothetical protein